MTCGRGARVSAALAVLALAGSAERAEALYDVSGETGSLHVGLSTKLFPVYTRTYETVLAPAENVWTAIGSVRLSADGALGELVRYDLAYHLFPTVTDTSSTSPGATGLQGGLVEPVPSPLRLWDIPRELTSSAHFTLAQNLDRLSLAVQAGPVEARVGRQAISHGSARILTSTDIFAPFSPASLDTEYKQGLDAVRVTWPLGERSELEGYAVFHSDDLTRGIYVLRARHSFTGFDVSVFGGSSYGAPTLALDASGDLGGSTLYGEALYRYYTPQNVRSQAAPSPLPGIDATPREHVVRATAGVHHYFESGLTVIGEAHFNGAGESDPADYLLAALGPEWQAGELFLLGRYYGALSLAYQLSDLVSVGLSNIVNVRDPSALVGPSLTWDSGDDTQVSVGALLGAGERPSGIVPASEFGLYPYSVYADLRAYF
jgi:hypothetical protein